MKQLPVAKINSIDVFENRIEDIFRHIRNGGTLTQLAKMWGFDYSELMKMIRSNPDRFKEYKASLEDRKEWANERILEELQYMAAYNIQDAVNVDGTLKRIQDLPEALARSIKEVDSEGSVKFVDKLKALDQKQKLLGLNVEKVELSGKLTLADLIIQAKKLED